MSYQGGGGRGGDRRDDYGRGGGNDRRGGDYDRRDDGYDRNRGGGGRYNDSHLDSSGSSRYGGSQYSHHSGTYGGGRDGYQGREHDMADDMGRMNMGGGRGGGGRGHGGNMYSDRSNRHDPRIQRSIGADEMADAAGGAHAPRQPIPKKDLIYNTQKFAPRPKEFVFDKKAVGTKTTLLTNHALVHLPEQTLQVYQYNIDVIENKKKLDKREKAAPVFWDIVMQNKRDMPPTKSKFYVFNDVNILWTLDPLPHGEGEFRAKRCSFYYKFAGRIDLGQMVREDQDKQVLASVIDAIATQRARRLSKKFVVWKRGMYMIQDLGTEAEKIDHPLTVLLGRGTDGRLGVNMGIRMNLRAGVTACYDVSHTMFTRTGYPLIRLLCELINPGPITDEEFEDIWDERLRNAELTERNHQEMLRILGKMKLRYSTETGIRIGADGIDANVPSLMKHEERGKEFKWERITSAPAEKQDFTDNNGKKWTIAEYFLACGIRLRYPNLPCVVKKPTKMNKAFVAYPMEFVSFVQEPKRIEKPGEEVKADLITKCSYNAPQRAALLQKIMSQVGIADTPPAIYNEDEYMKKFEISIDKNMLEVNATVLPPPTLVYGEGSTFKDEERLGEWTAITHEPIRKVLEGSTLLRNKENKDAPPMKKRLLGSIMQVGSPYNKHADMQYDPHCYHSLMRAIEAAGQPVAWEHEEMGQAAIQDAYLHCQGVTQVDDIRNFFDRLKNNIDDKYKQAEDEVLIPFVLVIFEARCSTLKMRNKDLMNDYNFIKYLGDNEQGIYTQGILIENLSVIQPNPIYCKLTRLIVEKILGKVGTTHRKLERCGDHKAWTKLTDPNEPTLILGVDVSHPSTADLKTDDRDMDIRKLSVATVVGNIDLDCTEYRASSRTQEQGEERIIKFQYEVNQRINAFIQNTGKRPAHIVLYRDGLSETDFKRTLYEERINVEDACLEVDPAYQPTITYIVVTKRHHTRFFLKNLSEGIEEQGFNIRPGTLVEDTVTTNEFYDFFLSTQVGEKGLARPTHYYVLHDTWAPLVSFWPTVTHALTYMFCRSTTTVALPAPVLYAHLAAKRAQETMEGVYEDAKSKRQEVNIRNFHHLQHLNKSINVHKDLDGMTFV